MTQMLYRWCVFCLYGVYITEPYCWLHLMLPCATAKKRDRGFGECYLKSVVLMAGLQFMDVALGSCVKGISLKCELVFIWICNYICVLMCGESSFSYLSRRMDHGTYTFSFPFGNCKLWNVAFVLCRQFAQYTVCTVAVLADL